MSESEQKRKWRIAKRLKLTRSAAEPKLSQTELARRVLAKGIQGFTASLASRLELGYADATWSEVEAVAAALGVQPAWLAEIETTYTQTAKIEVPKVPQLESAPLASPQPGLAAAAARAPQSAPAPVATAAPLSVTATPPATTPAPAAPLPPIPVPTQGTSNIYEYRTLLGLERKKADEAMAQKGLRPAEWRRWREYASALTETLRTLQI